MLAWNRPVWAALLLAGAFAFCHVLLNPSSGYLADSTRTPFITTVILLVGFAVVSVLFWWYFRRREARLPRQEEPVVHEP